MNQYSNQIYFNVLCEEYSIIHDEFMRILSAEDGKTIGYSKEYNVWADRLNDIKNRIYSFLDDVKNQGETMIFCKKEQTEVFIRFYATASFNSCKIINVGKEFEGSVPEDALSQEFYQA